MSLGVVVECLQLSLFQIAFFFCVFSAGPLSGARGVLQAVQSFGLRTVHRWRYRWKHGNYDD